MICFVLNYPAPSSPDLSPAVSLTNLQEICNDNEVDTNPLLDVGTTEAVLDVADTESTFTVGFRTEFTDEEFQVSIEQPLICFSLNITSLVSIVKVEVTC